jgi:Ca2+-binding RTX toxin-like protein
MATTAWGSELLANTITIGDQAEPSVTGLSDGRFVVMWMDFSNTLGDNDLCAVHGQIFNAHGNKVGAEFLVNTETSGSQAMPVVTALPGGRFATAWGDGGTRDLFLQVFNADGSKAGSQLKVNTTDAANQQRQAITTLADGRFVVSWEDNSGGNYDIRAQIFNANGTKWGSEFIAASGAFKQIQSSVVGLSDGRFAIAWESSGVDGSGAGIRAQIFDSNGAKWGLELAANSTTLDDQTTPWMTALANGRFVIAWTDESKTGGDVSSRAVRAQVFNFDGSKSGSEFLVNTTTSATQGFPVITALNDGRFAVAFTDASTSPDDISGTAVRVQLFNPNGTKSGAEFRANIGTMADFQHQPAITTLVDGRLVVAYTDESQTGGDTSGSAVRAQIFDPRTVAVHLTGAGLNDQFVGTQFNDTLIGGIGDDFIDSWYGADLIEGGPGADYLYGRNSGATASYQSSNTGVIIDLYHGTASGGHAEGDTLDELFNIIGSAHDDVLIAADESQALDGGARNDVLDGGTGNTVLIGGTGDDTFVVNSLANSVVEKPNEGTDTIRTALASYDLTTRPHVENLKGLAETGQILFGNGQDNIISARGGNDRLVGGGGNDTLKGGGGDDTLNGSIGDDTAVFTQSIDKYTVHDLGDRVLVTGAEGTDTLFGVEHLQFADGTIDVVDDGSQLFDSLYYLSRNPDVFHAGLDALSHYNMYGWHEGRDPNAFFDTAGYLAVNPDVAASGTNPLEHYRVAGWLEGRDPSAAFDTTLYLVNHPNVAAMGVNPLEHYLMIGRAKGYAAHEAVGAAVNGFDAQYYLFHNPDVAAAGVDPLFHYNSVGWHEGRNPNGWFDSAGYLAHNPDVAAAGVNPLQHYETVGWTEGRDPSAGFDTLGYLAANPDVAMAGINPLDHFLQVGIYEGRQAVNDGMWS